MSVGRIEAGSLICRYHGWRFEGGQEGRCTACPQASDAGAETTVRESSRSRLEMHPSQVPVAWNLRDRSPAHLHANVLCECSWKQTCDREQAVVYQIGSLPGENMVGRVY